MTTAGTNIVLTAGTNIVPKAGTAIFTAGVTAIVEAIPNEDSVTRAVVRLPGDIDPMTWLPFQYRDGERAESVFWRKYAPALADVHSRGCRLQAIQNERQQKNNSPRSEYIGSKTAIVGVLRAIKNKRGHKFRVTHRPEGGDLAHAHISIEDAGGALVEKISKNERLELVDLLWRNLGKLEPHRC